MMSRQKHPNWALLLEGLAFMIGLAAGTQLLIHLF